MALDDGSCCLWEMETKGEMKDREWEECKHLIDRWWTGSGTRSTQCLLNRHSDGEEFFVGTLSSSDRRLDLARIN